MLLMLFGQLQDIEEECKELLEVAASAREGEVETMRRRVKQRRVEIEEMRREVFGLKAEVKKKRQLEKCKEEVRTGIEKVRSFAGKEKTQSKRLQDLVERAEQKCKIQQRRIGDIQAQQAILAEFEGCLQSSLQNSRRYAVLKQKLNVVSTQLLSQKMGNNLQLQRRKEQLKALEANHTSVDEQIANLSQQITIQQQIINEISSIEGPQIHDNRSFDILSKEQQVFFKRKQELDMWEKHELQGLLHKREIQKEKERKIGSIWRQRFSTQSHKERPIINRSFTHSQEQSAKTNESSDLRFISSDRMKQLQKNKRIRTRYTEPRIYQPQASPVSQTHISEQPDSPSILTIYEQFKKQRMPSHNSIKLLRSHNKKRSLNQHKGVPLQLQHFD